MAALLDRTISVCAADIFSALGRPGAETLQRPKAVDRAGNTVPASREVAVGEGQRQGVRQVRCAG
jgi:hypothetical protein